MTNKADCFAQNSPLVTSTMTTELLL